MAAQRDLIGIFDSGVGGLSIAAAIRTLLPQESLLYLADQAHFPYGGRDEEEVRELALHAAEFLTGEGAKLVVVACNTASSVALGALRASFPVPFVGVVPGVKPGSAATQGGSVGVLATEATFHTRVFNDLVAQFAEGAQLCTLVRPDLVACVERGTVEGDAVEADLRDAVEQFAAAGVDTIVLGCTHYSFLATAIRRLAGPAVTVIDTAAPVARQVRRVLEERGLLAEGEGLGSLRLCTTGDRDTFLRVARKLWPEGAPTAP
ncbi:MAG: glutamate racemase [Chloroflexi bacterium]|nr:glutamate racemase [Chloroflexota bacterium]